MRRAVFLDRDGVLIRDVDLLVDWRDCEVFGSVGRALTRLRERGFHLLVVSNQSVLARGLLDQGQFAELQSRVVQALTLAGCPPLDAFYYCPHHPKATLPEYRLECECRKPRPGMLLRAAREHQIDLQASFRVGDRMTDIAAGAAAGCRTVLVRTGAHLAAPIHTVEPLNPDLRPDHTCADLAEAADWILEVM